MENNIKRLYMDDTVGADFKKVWFSSFYRKEIPPARIVKNATIVAKANLSQVSGILAHECSVFDENLNLVPDTNMFGIEFGAVHFPHENIEFIDKEVIFCGRLFLHYGHFLIQSTTRLYQYIKDKSKNPYVAFAIGEGEKIPKFALEFFELLEIPKDKIILVSKATKFKCVICPPISSVTKYQTAAIESSGNFCDFTDEFMMPFREAAKKVDPAPYKKVYFTRKYWTDVAQCLGEKDIEKVFVKNGFKSFAPEKFSLKEQIALVKGAHTLAAINGSSLHTVLFANKNLKLIILNRNEEYDFQYIINEAVEADWYVVQAYANIFEVSESTGPFIIGMTKYLKEFFKDHNFDNCNVTLNIKKYAKDFLNLYCKIYSEDYFYRTLSSTKKDKLIAKNVINAFALSAHSIFLQALYYILYHITFGTLKIKYRNRHRVQMALAKTKKEMPMTWIINNDEVKG